MNDDRQLGWGLAAGGMLLVSTDSLFVRLAEAGPWDIALLVAVFSLPVYLLLNRRLETIGPVEAVRAAPGPLLAVAALAGLSQLSFIAAITRTEVANAVVIVAAAPIVAALVARFTIGERTSRQVWFAIAVTAAGIGIVVSGSLGEPNLDGDLLAVLAIVSFAFSLTIWRRHPDLSRYVGLALASALTIVATIGLADPFGLDRRTYLAAAAMGLVFSPAGRIAHSSAPRFAPAAEVALFAPVETVAATAWAWLAFAEPPSGTAVVGGVVVVGGVLLGTVATSAGPKGAEPTIVSS